MCRLALALLVPPVLRVRADRLVRRAQPVRLDQQVWLVRDPTIRCSAATWHATAAWRVPRARLITVREVVKDQVSKFVNDYLAVNPKPPASK